MLNLWLFVHERHERSPTGTRIVVQYVDPSVARPLVIRILGHYEGFSSRNLLVRWTHRVECPDLVLCDWPAACTAEELHAPRIAMPTRRRIDADADADASPFALVLPPPHAGARPTTLELERLSFKRVLVARPDVGHTRVVIGGKPTGQSLEEAADSAGDAEECFTKITTGAASLQEEVQAEHRNALIVQMMAAIEQQRERIRNEAEADELLGV